MPVPSSIVTKSAGDDAVGAVDVGVRRLVAAPDERRARHGPDEVAALAEHRLAQRRADDQPLAVEVDLDVVGRRIDRRPRVRGQGPRRGGPHDERGADEPGVVRLHDREPQEHARVLDGLVAERDLGVGQRRAASRAVRRDLVGFLQQARARRATGATTRPIRRSSVLIVQ